MNEPPANDIERILQDYQAVRLAGYVASFRNDFIRNIFLHALLAEWDANCIPLAKRLNDFFFTKINNEGSLIQPFEDWLKEIPDDQHGILFGDLTIQEYYLKVTNFLQNLPGHCLSVRHFFNEFMSKFEIPGVNEGKHAREKLKAFFSSENGKIILEKLVIGYLRSPAFDDYLRTPKNNSQNTAATPGKPEKLGLENLFNVLIFTVTDHEREQSRIRIISPPVREHENHGTGVAFGSLQQLLQTLPDVALQEDGSVMRKLKIGSGNLKYENPTDAPPGLRTALTTAIYQTCWHDDNRDKELEFLLAGVNIIQILPSPREKLLKGFLCFFSPVAGLVKAILPPDEMPPDSRCKLQDEINESHKVKELGSTWSKIRCVELQRDWAEIAQKDWAEKFPAKHPYVPFIVGLLNWSPPWTERLYQGMCELQDLSQSLLNKITPLIREAEIKPFARKIMHELNRDMNGLREHLRTEDAWTIFNHLTSIRNDGEGPGLSWHNELERLRVLAQKNAELDQAFNAAHYKIAAFFRLTGDDPGSMDKIVDREMLPALRMAWQYYMELSFSNLSVIDEHSPDWGIRLKGMYEGDLEFLFSVLLRNARQYRKPNTPVEVQLKKVSTGWHLIWMNETDLHNAEKLKNSWAEIKKNPAPNFDLSRGLDFMRFAASKIIGGNIDCVDCEVLTEDLKVKFQLSIPDDKVITP